MILVWESSQTLCMKEQRSIAKEMLKDALYRTTKKCLDAMDIEVNQHGKPFFLGEKDLYFNISHCEDAVALCVDRVPCGIDVERILPLSEEVARIVLSNEEKDRLKQVKEQDYYFSALWVLKESVVKCLGLTVGPGMKKYSFTDLFVEERFISTHRNNNHLPVYQVETQEILCSLYHYGDHMIATAHRMPKWHLEKEPLISWKRAKKKAEKNGLPLKM